MCPDQDCWLERFYFARGTLSGELNSLARAGRSSVYSNWAGTLLSAGVIEGGAGEEPRTIFCPAGPKFSNDLSAHFRRLRGTISGKMRSPPARAPIATGFPVHAIVIAHMFGDHSRQPSPP